MPQLPHRPFRMSKLQDAFLPAVAIAGGAWVYLTPMQSSSRLLRAQSGSNPPDDTRLRRRPSWEHKFEAPEMDVELVKKDLNASAERRLQRRPSWASKFEAPDMNVEQVKKEINASAEKRLQRRPSWASKFEAPDMNVEQVKKEINASAEQRLQRRPSWASKFEAPELNDKARAEFDEMVKAPLKATPPSPELDMLMNSTS